MHALRIVGAALAVMLLGAASSDPVASPVEKIMTAARVPGVQVAVVDHGRIVALHAYGVQDVATKSPVDDHTRFEIGSITKQFTAAAILQLKAAGKVRLDDTLAKYLPEYAAAKDVTIAQMLGQVSGIPDYTKQPAFIAMVAPIGGRLTIPQRGDFAAMLAIVRDKPLDFAPGTQWAYSNTNYELLGRIVEIASGMPWQAYVRAHIFVPAGMTESGFMQDEPAMRDAATGYATDGGTLIPTRSFNGWTTGAGSIVSTASDVAKWDVALFGGKIVSADDLALMTQPGAFTALSASMRYGFGWLIDAFEGQRRLWHNGGTLGFAASNEVYPALSQAIVVLDNNAESSTDAIAEAVFNALHPDIAAAAAPTTAPGEDPAITARAKRVWNDLVAGHPDRSEYTDRFNAAMTPDVLAGATEGLKRLGTPTTWTYAGSTAAGGAVSYDYRVQFAIGVTITVTMTLAPDGKIAGYVAHA